MKKFYQKCRDRCSGGEFFPEKIFAAGDNADLVIFGNFYTVDEKNPKAEAVAIKDGKFIYVGNKIGVKDFIGKNTKQKNIIAE